MSKWIASVYMLMMGGSLGVTIAWCESLGNFLNGCVLKADD